MSRPAPGRGPGMRAPQNPYAGTYSPARTTLTKADLIKGLKGLKIKQPNKKYSENAYKVGLPKEHESQE